MRRGVLLLVAALCGRLTTRPCAAQQLGQRIRVTTDSAPAAWLIGRVGRVDADSFRIDVAGRSPTWVLRTQVRRFEVSRGRGSAVGAGALQGADFGALLGAVVAARGMAKPCAWPTAAAVVCGEERILAGSGLGAGVGAIIGAAIGSLIKRERWDALSAAQPQIVLSPDRTALALSLAFSHGHGRWSSGAFGASGSTGCARARSPR